MQILNLEDTAALAGSPMGRHPTMKTSRLKMVSIGINPGHMTRIKFHVFGEEAILKPHVQLEKTSTSPHPFTSGSFVRIFYHQPHSFSSFILGCDHYGRFSDSAILQASPYP